jgi:hypothetical protein
MKRRIWILALALGIAIPRTAAAFPIHMDPVVTEPAPGFALRLTLRSTDTLQGHLRFRLEPVSGAWDQANNDGFYHFAPNSIDSIVGGSTSFVQLSLGCGSSGCFNSLHLGAGGIDPGQPAYVEFIALDVGTVPFAFDITHSANQLPGGPHAFARAVVVPEPGVSLLLAIGFTALVTVRRRGILLAIS